MTEYRMNTRSIPLSDEWDVIVVGGGPAGCTAATAAAREGAKTLLIEATGCLGGMATSGLVPAWCPFSDNEKIIYRGLAEKVLDTCKAGLPHVSSDALDWIPIDHEHLKRIFDNIVVNAGAEVLFFTTLATVETDKKGNVSVIITCNKDGLSAYRAKVYVDCTGDGDLAAYAGAEVMKGDEQTGELQPATHCFVLTNVDDFAFKTGPNLQTGSPESPVHHFQNSKHYPHIKDSFCCAPIKGPGVVGFNASHVWDVDGTNSHSLSRGIMEGRKVASEFRDALAEFYPKAFANSFLIATGDLLGIRETRRIVGDYMLTIDDWMARRKFPDEICRNSYAVDVHKNLEEVQSGKRKELWKPGSNHYRKGETHGIPYRCLTPKNLANVLVAGRPISSDRIINGSLRIMPVCLVTGEAAGLAAALAANSTCSVHNVDIKQLRSRLQEEGAFLPD